MKKQNANLISLVTALAMIFLLSECSTKKQEEQKEEGDKMEMPDAKPAEQKATEVKLFENVDPSVKIQLNGFLKDYFAYCERRRKRLTLERVASVSRPVRPPLAGSSDRGFDHIRE